MSSAGATKRRWQALGFIGLAQLMVVLDATIVNIALPSAQRDLHISDANRQWVVTAYALTFGGLLLIGGRIADRWGRRASFAAGLVGFAAASALGGAAANTGMLLVARALQGAAGALLTPAALSLLALSFTDARERAKAFGIYGAIAGGGGAIGLVLGGLLTQYLNWRWTLYINVGIAALAVLGTVFVISEPPGTRNRDPIDIPGVVLAGTGLTCLVYAFTRAQNDGWQAHTTTGMFGAAVLLLIIFVIYQAKAKAPLLPLRVVWDRSRSGAYLSLGLAVIGMFGVFLFLTFYLQVVLGYSPLTTGLAFLPLVAGMMIGSTQVAARLMTRVPARMLMAPGLLLAAGALALLAHIREESSYVALVLPAFILLGAGLGTAFMPAMNLATSGVRPTDAGIASAMVSTSQQIGGAIGTALLSTIATSATTTYQRHHVRKAVSPESLRALARLAMVHGFATAIWWAVAIVLLGAVLAAVLINARPCHGEVSSGSAPDLSPYHPSLWGDPSHTRAPDLALHHPSLPAVG